MALGDPRGHAQEDDHGNVRLSLCLLRCLRAPTCSRGHQESCTKQRLTCCPLPPLLFRGGQRPVLGGWRLNLCVVLCWRRYHELARISGEVDKQKVWGSAAKFELMLWSSSPDRVGTMCC